MPIWCLSTLANGYFKVLLYFKAILYDAKNDSKYRDVAALSCVCNGNDLPLFNFLFRKFCSIDEIIVIN